MPAFATSTTAPGTGGASSTTSPSSSRASSSTSSPGPSTEAAASTSTAASRRSRLSSSVALVTGAAGGIGGATVDALEAAGHDVVSTDLPLDVTDEDAITELVARTESDRGPIDVLVNCAGHIAETPIERISNEEWDRMLRVHLGGTWHTCRAAGPRMAARGRGSIVNVSSELALCGAELHAHYCAAKGAIVGLTKAHALELAPSGV